MIMFKRFSSIYFYLSTLRIALCLIVLIDVALSIPTLIDLDSFYFKNFSAVSIDSSLLAQYIPYFLGIYVLSLLLFLFGIGKGFSSFFLFLFSLFFHYLFHSMYSGVGMIISTTFLFLIPVDSYRYFSIRQADYFDNPYAKVLHNIGVAFLYLHINYIFLSTAIHKMFNESWLNGLGVIHGAEDYNFDVFALKDVLYKIDEFWLICMGFFVLYIQLFFPILMLNKTSRLLTVLAIVFTHIGIALIMYLFKFQSIIFLLLPIVFFKNQIFKNLKLLYSN